MRMALHALVCSWLLVLVTAPCWAQRPMPAEHGRVFQSDEELVVWHEEKAGWITVEQFWLDHAGRSSGKYWGRAAEYPPYRAVKEHDTLMIELESGSCLMEFFHRRWRRAQDVWRWDPAFNDYGACPHVFD